MWNNLTIQQVQQIDELRSKLSKDATDADADSEVLAIIDKVTVSTIDSMAWLTFQERRKELAFLLEAPKYEPLQTISIGKRRYKFVYDIRQMPFARYIEGKTFAQDFVKNLHKLAATMVLPMKRTWYGKWVTDKYDAANHEQYATDMLQAPYGSIYSSALFFCNLYRNWIIALRDYMIKEQVSKGKTQEEAEQLVNALCQSLDGIIQPNK